MRERGKQKGDVNRPFHLPLVLSFKLLASTITASDGVTAEPSAAPSSVRDYAAPPPLHPQIKTDRSVPSRVRTLTPSLLVRLFLENPSDLTFRPGRAASSCWAHAAHVKQQRQPVICSSEPGSGLGPAAFTDSGASYS